MKECKEKHEKEITKPKILDEKLQWVHRKKKKHVARTALRNQTKPL